MKAMVHQTPTPSRVSPGCYDGRMDSSSTVVRRWCVWGSIAALVGAWAGCGSTKTKIAPVQRADAAGTGGDRADGGAAPDTDGGGGAGGAPDGQAGGSARGGEPGTGGQSGSSGGGADGELGGGGAAGEEPCTASSCPAGQFCAYAIWDGLVRVHRCLPHQHDCSTCECERRDFSDYYQSAMPGGLPPDCRCSASSGTSDDGGAPGTADGGQGPVADIWCSGA